MKLAVLNTSIVTSYGSFTYEAIDLNVAKSFIRQADADGQLLSAVGHQSTADTITELTGVEVQMNRIQFAQEPGQKAIVFKLKDRAPEGKILDREEIEAIGYEFGLLTRTA